MPEQIPRMGSHARISPNIRWRYPARCSVGPYSIIDDFCYFSCALQVGFATHIAANCTFLGGGEKVIVGDFVNIAPGCRIASASNDYVDGGLSGACIPEQFRGISIKGPVRIEDFCLLGAGTVVLPGVRFPIGAVSGAMTLLTDKIHYQPWTLYVGIPARPIKMRYWKTILEQAAKMRKELMI